MTETDDRFDPRSGRHAGDVIVLANFVGTMAFAITAVTAAIVFTTAAQWVGAITAMSLFAVSGLLDAGVTERLANPVDP